MFHHFPHQLYILLASMVCAANKMCGDHKRGGNMVLRKERWLLCQGGSFVTLRSGCWTVETFCKVGKRSPSQICGGFGDGDCSVIQIPSEHGLEIEYDPCPCPFKLLD